MDDPLIIIDKIKKSLEEIMEENNIGYLGFNIDNILNYYSSDLASILINYYPGSTIMMHKFYKSCSTLINGKVYNYSGIVDRFDYHIANEEEINYIKKSFPNMSDSIINMLNEKLYGDNTKDISYTLRKNSEI